ncbi:hypothetical protein Mapa_015049 [Marchantia paleacea]|nr:hypothetical protein Mapa_015049 [Marchantia paleacea]
MESLEEYPLVDSESKEKGGRNARKLRIFDEKMRNLCWQKADVVPGRHPERWRKDIAGNVVCRSLTRCKGCLCYDNCQILQSRVNRLKSDKDDLGKQDLQQLSCNIKFGEKELDLIEMAVYGNVERPGLQCRCKSVAESLGTSLSKAKGPQMSCELPYKSTS